MPRLGAQFTTGGASGGETADGADDHDDSEVGYAPVNNRNRGASGKAKRQPRGGGNL